MKAPVSNIVALLNNSFDSFERAWEGYWTIRNWKGEELKYPVTVRVKDHPANPYNVAPPFLSIVVSEEEAPEEFWVHLSRFDDGTLIYGATQRTVDPNGLGSGETLEAIEEAIDNLIEATKDGRANLYYATVIQ